MCINEVQTQPLRILHMIGVMDVGGAETWLMNVLRHIDRTRFQMDFATLHPKDGVYDDEIRALGSRIIPCPGYDKPLRFAKHFHRILNEYGPYDIVHSHVHHYSGYIMRLARSAGIPGRIAHSHTAMTETSPSIYRRAYLATTRQWIRKYATVTLAVSNDAANALVGPSWQTQHCQLHFCGINLAAFRCPKDRNAVRREFGIPADALVIGNTGRFEEVKNHAFLLRIFAHALEIDKRFHLLLVGDGSLRQDIVHQAESLDINDHITFTGIRNDVGRIMTGTMDLFILTSKYEGLPLALVEAQAAGLPCIISDVIPKESTIVPSLVQRISLSAPIAKWVAAIVKMQKYDYHKNQDVYRKEVAKSPFNIETSVKELEQIYVQQSHTA